MLGGRLAAMLAVAAIGPASAPIMASAPVTVDFADAVGICRLAFVEQLQGKPPRQALAKLEAMDAAHREPVKALCAAYAIGQQDLAAAIQAARDAANDEAAPEPAPAPAGQPI